MSYNFNPQPNLTNQGLQTASMHAPIAPTINNPASPGGLNFLTQNYWEGAVRINPGNSLEGEVSPFGNHQRGVISFWMQYEPNHQTSAGWPLIGQQGNVNMLIYFGTDAAHGTMGCAQIELVPLSQVVTEFSSGAT